MILFFLFLIPTVLLLIIWQHKVDFYNKRIEGEKLEAIVVRFVKENQTTQNESVPNNNDFSLLLNDYIIIPYAYVKLNNYEEKLVRLNYPFSSSPPYKVGDKVSVFWYAGVLHFWDAYDTGIRKFLPSKWAFWSN